MSAPRVEAWAVSGKLDHDASKVIANIADTALVPEIAVAETVSVLNGLFG